MKLLFIIIIINFIIIILYEMWKKNISYQIIFLENGSKQWKKKGSWSSAMRPMHAWHVSLCIDHMAGNHASTFDRWPHLKNQKDSRIVMPRDMIWLVEWHNAIFTRQTKLQICSWKLTFYTRLSNHFPSKFPSPWHLTSSLLCLLFVS